MELLVGALSLVNHKGLHQGCIYGRIGVVCVRVIKEHIRVVREHIRVVKEHIRVVEEHIRVVMGNA